MTVEELADYIKEYKDGNIPYPYGDEFIIEHHIRSVLNEHIHITNEHILECCVLKRQTMMKFIEICRPLAKADTEAYLREWNKPAPKGRTRRRFR